MEIEKIEEKLRNMTHEERVEFTMRLLRLMSELANVVRIAKALGI